VGIGSSTGGIPCIAAPDGRLYFDGQSATYIDWCRPGTLSVFCGSGTKMCQNGTWIASSDVGTLSPL
jgi:hypothetical protein